jgi:putative hemolysin
MTGYLPTAFTLALCLILSFVLSGMEAGVFALNRLRLRRLARGGNPQARLLHQFLETPENFLWTILVGNTLVNFLVLGWVIIILHEWLPGRPVPVVALFALALFLFYAFFDLLPKMLFRAYPNRLCLSSANVLRFVQLALRPVVAVVEGVSQMAGGRAFTGRLFGSRKELRAVMQEASQALTGEEHAMVNRVLDLENLSVAQITTPLAKTVGIEAASPLREALALAREKNLTRLPVWETREGRRRIAGLLDVGALLFRAEMDWEKPVSTHMAPAVFVNENVRLDVALRLMQRVGQRLAIVLTHDRREIGVVSLEDILRVMFGEVKL